MSTLRIAFFGSAHSFGYHEIGGAPSFVRRLSRELVRSEGIEVDLITFGHPKAGQESHVPGLRSLNLRMLSDALKILPDYHHVVSIYCPPKDRIRFMLFRGRSASSTRYHKLFFSWPDSRLKRKLSFLEAILVPFNGRLFGVSYRMVRRLSYIDPKSVLLLPPVPMCYFVSLASKPHSDRTRVVFIGRLDPGKGALEAIESFSLLSRDKNVELEFYGMHWPHDPVSVALREQLMHQRLFRYVDVDFFGHDASVDAMVERALKNADILIQPYRKLSSTMDTPVLLMEAMASLTAFVTHPQGDIPAIYGTSPCLIPEGRESVTSMISLIQSAQDWLTAERARIERQRQSLEFEASAVARGMMEVFLDYQ